jgi:hypothetical protein
MKKLLMKPFPFWPCSLNGYNTLIPIYIIPLLCYGPVVTPSGMQIYTYVQLINYILKEVVVGTLRTGYHRV